MTYALALECTLLDDGSTRIWREQSDRSPSACSMACAAKPSGVFLLLHLSDLFSPRLSIPFGSQAQTCSELLGIQIDAAINSGNSGGTGMGSSCQQGDRHWEVSFRHSGEFGSDRVAVSRH